MKNEEWIGKKTNKSDGDFEVWIDDSKTEPFGKYKLPLKTEEQKMRQDDFFKELDEEFGFA